MILDWHTGIERMMAIGLCPCNAFDAATGEEVPAVHYYDTATHELRRYVMDCSGRPKKDPSGGGLERVTEMRKLRFESMDGKPIEIVE